MPHKPRLHALGPIDSFACPPFMNMAYVMTWFALISAEMNFIVNCLK